MLSWELRIVSEWTEVGIDRDGQQRVDYKGPAERSNVVRGIPRIGSGMRTIKRVCAVRSGMVSQIWSQASVVKRWLWHGIIIRVLGLWIEITVLRPDRIVDFGPDGISKGPVGILIRIPGHLVVGVIRNQRAEVWDLIVRVAAFLGVARGMVLLRPLLRELIVRPERPVAGFISLGEDWLRREDEVRVPRVVWIVGLTSPRPNVRIWELDGWVLGGSLGWKRVSWRRIRSVVVPIKYWIED